MTAAAHFFAGLAIYLYLIGIFMTGGSLIGTGHRRVALTIALLWPIFAPVAICMAVKSARTSRRKP